MRASLIFLFVFSVVICSTDAQAQVTAVNTQVSAYDQTADGKPSTCGLNYVVIHTENLNKPGKLIGITGSFSWVIAPGHKFFALHKTVGFDFDEARPVKFPINYHFFSTNTASFARKEQNYFESDGGKVAGYNATMAAEVFAAVMGSPALFVSYNRHAGEQDVRVPLDVHAALSPADRNAFNACMQAIVAQAEAE